jgi:hypothetical protein
VLVDDLDDGHVLVDAQAGVGRDAGGHEERLGRGVHLRRLHAPGLVHPDAGLIGEHLAAHADDTRPDLEAPLELFPGEQRGDARVPEEYLRLVGVEGLDDLVQRREHRQWRRPRAARVERGEQPPRDVQGIRRADRNQARVGRDSAAREDAQCDRHP